jgi:hypothetical protein
VGTTDNQPLVIKTNGGEALRVTPDGHVGIGTSQPATSLHVGGDLTLDSADGPVLLTGTGQARVPVTAN